MDVLAIANSPKQRAPMAPSGRAGAEALEVRVLLSTYYVAETGNDAAAGTSPQTAWRSVERVNATNLEPGDQVLFEGGKTFTLPQRSGTELAQGSFGGAATISGSASTRTFALAGIRPGRAYTVRFLVRVDNPTDGRAAGGVRFFKGTQEVGGIQMKLRNSVQYDRARDFVAPPEFDRAELYLTKLSGSSVVRLQRASVRETSTPLVLDKFDAGTPTQPVVIGSFGTGRATISAGDATGISVNDAPGIVVRDLIVRGSWNSGTASGSNVGAGVEFVSFLPADGKHRFARVQNVDVSGFKWAGVIFEGRLGKAGFADVQVTDTVAHHNGDVGITLIRTQDDGAAYAYTDVYVARCRTFENTGMTDKNLASGWGMTVEDCDRAVVEHNVSYFNGTFNNASSGGPVGIMAANSNAVTIQFNESYGTRSASGKDGGGLDIDGGMTNSVMQYNYSHDNEGPGLHVAQYDIARPNWGNNVIRYNVSEDDARKHQYGAIHLYGGAAIRDLEVYHNTVFLSPGQNAYNAAILSRGVGAGVRVRNNIFYTTGGVALVRHEGGTAPVFQGNDYWPGGTAGFKIKWGSTVYGSLAAWRSGTGQEKDGTAPTGRSVDPRLAGPGAGGTIGQPGQLGTLAAYRLLSGSPMIDAGINLPARTGTLVGTRDFYGTPIPQGSGFDIGAAERSQSPSGSATLVASDDAFVRDGTYAGQNFGTATQLELKKAGTGYTREIYLKFGLSDVGSIKSARLRLFGRIDSTTERPSVAAFGASGTTWTQSGLTWNNRPAAGAAALATLTVAGSTPSWYEWDVSGFVAQQKAAGAGAVTLVLRSLTATTPHLIFSSIESGANRPQLVLGL